MNYRTAWPSSLTLPSGETVLFDPEDYPLICGFKWSKTKLGSLVYARGRVYLPHEKRYRQVLMHRLILGAKLGTLVDHVDQNPLNNRRENLRFCTRSENGCNRRAPSLNTSGYKGVSWDSARQKWTARIREYKGPYHYLGYFACKHDAARAYNEAALKYHGEFASLNEVEE